MRKKKRRGGGAQTIAGLAGLRGHKKLRTCVRRWPGYENARNGPRKHIWHPQNQRRQPNHYRPRLSQNPVDVQIRHFREEVEELLMSVRSMQRAIRNLEIACANRFIGRQHVRSPNASE